MNKIATKCRALLSLIERPDGTIVWKWAEAAIAEHSVSAEEAKLEWLQLKWLLALSIERAEAAGAAAEAVLHNFPASGVPNPPGRPTKDTADMVTLEAALIYERFTGAFARRECDRKTREPCGAFHDFLTKVFEALEIDDSPDTANARLQAALKAAE